MGLKKCPLNCAPRYPGHIQPNPLARQADSWSVPVSVAGKGNSTGCRQGQLWHSSQSWSPDPLPRAVAAARFSRTCLGRSCISRKPLPTHLRSGTRQPLGQPQKGLPFTVELVYPSPPMCPAPAAPAQPVYKPGRIDHLHSSWLSGLPTPPGECAHSAHG